MLLERDILGVPLEIGATIKEKGILGKKTGSGVTSRLQRIMLSLSHIQTHTQTHSSVYYVFFTLLMTE